ncbi:MAG: hypothetical protein Q7R43_04155 [Candidatus Daviesbacteria bacterium]|nr:hypothetical protein [Candidatus Daviesbacteria bacterium]
MSKFRFWATLILAIFLGIVGFVLGEIIPLPEPYTFTQSRILYALFGVLIGLLSYAQISAWVVKTTTRLIGDLVGIIASEVAERITHRASADLEHTKDEVSPDTIIIDTSSIIDGRILDVAKTGFLCGNILVPEFVLLELQQVADSADSIKRARGRKGFETLNQMKKIKGLKIEVWEADLPELKKYKEVDEKLIHLAKHFKAKLLTCDFNLNRVARLKGLSVLNVNELANSLKTLPIPGEEITVKIVHQGKDKNQGVGYLRDGTMIVVKDGAEAVGEEINIEVLKVLQGNAGRMVFGVIPNRAR